MGMVAATWHRAVVAPLLTAIGRLPADTAARLGGFLGVLAWRLGVRRRVVAANLARCLGLRGPARQAVARRAYATVGANFVELWGFGQPDGAQTTLRVLNPRWLDHVLARHPGLVMITAHLGSWDVSGWAVAQRTSRCVVYAKSQSDARLDARVNAQRLRAGMEVVMAGEAGAAVSVLRMLRGRGVLGVLADQRPSGSQGAPAWLLGQPCRCHDGATFFAARARVPVLPAFSVRVRSGETVFFIGRPLTAAGRDPGELLQAAVDRLSAMIARFPGQYFWHHRRFKHLIDLPRRDAEPWRTQGLRLLG